MNNEIGITYNRDDDDLSFLLDSIAQIQEAIDLTNNEIDILEHALEYGLDDMNQLIEEIEVEKDKIRALESAIADMQEIVKYHIGDYQDGINVQMNLKGDW